MALAAQSLIGVFAIPLLVWLFSQDRRAYSGQKAFKLIAITLLVQFLIALGVLHLPFMTAVFAGLTQAVGSLQSATQSGTQFLFGYLAGGDAPFSVTKPQNSVLIAFSMLPLILVLSALVRLLYYWGILQRVVAFFALLLRRGLGISGPVATASAASIFLGTVEAPMLVRPYLSKMSRGQLFATMVVGMSTVAGTVLAIYASVLEPVLTGAAGHLLAASVVNVPGALLLARLSVPKGFEVAHQDAQSVQISIDGAPQSSMDAIVQGTLDGLRLVTTVAAMLIVIVSLVSLVNMILGGIFEPFGWTVTMQGLLGVLLAPLAWLIGIPWSEAATAGSLLGQKLVLNEFIGYFSLVNEPKADLSDRSTLLMTYAMCGFANLGSLGIMIGGFSAMVPSRRDEVVALAPRAVVVGFLVTLQTAALIGVTQF